MSRTIFTKIVVPGKKDMMTDLLDSELKAKLQAVENCELIVNKVKVKFLVVSLPCKAGKGYHVIFHQILLVYSIMLSS